MILLVTGTGTGVGKTVFTTHLTRHWRATRPGATLAMKPFCSGGREDAELLWRACDGEISLDEVNPWHFEAPVTPLLAARQAGVKLLLRDALQRITNLAARCDTLIVEGAGGLLSPLGEDFDTATLARELGAEVLLVAPNRLGVLNDARLNAEVVAGLPATLRAVVLMDQASPDLSATDNAEILRELLPIPVIRFPWLSLG